MVDSSGELVCQINASKAETYPFGGGWYFPREQIEQQSLSRRDGISVAKEKQLRKSYSAFLKDLGMRLELPQSTIATSIVFCHRFFLRQSHAKNDRFLIATACMFLAGKAEETPKLLKNVLPVSYEIRHKKDKTAAADRICSKEIYEHEKERVLLAENLLLQTLGFDLTIIHPYTRLLTGMKKLKISNKHFTQVAWNFLNDALQTTLCLQYEAHHIAAGAIFLAAKILKIKLPTDGEKPWWQELEVNAPQLEDVSNQMLELYEQHRDSTLSPSDATGSVASPEMPPATPQALEKRINKVRGRAEHDDGESHACYNLSNSLQTLHGKESVEKAELCELESVDVLMESKKMHPKCKSKGYSEAEPKRPCSGFMI